jgi:lysophospholipase L1-like esterase
MKQAAKILIVWVFAFVATGVCFEVGLRYFDPLPVHGGVYRDRDGNIVRIAQDELTLRPNLDVIHSSPEFSAEMHTDALGFRKIANESRTPDYLFLGDSFTFGHGVADKEVFSSIFCEKRGVSCLNLGRSGTDTFEQVRILQNATDKLGLRPRKVVVVMLVACSLNISGNDLADNLNERMSAKGNGGMLALTLALDGLGVIKKIQGWVGGFEITKRAMLLMSSGLKRGLYSCSDEASIERALDATDVALAELENLSKKLQFKVSIFFVHPYQELDGAFRTTESYLRKLPPRHLDPHFTAQYFRREHYYPYDGHFNPAGHANMASVIEAALTAK